MLGYLTECWQIHVAAEHHRWKLILCGFSPKEQGWTVPALVVVNQKLNSGNDIKRKQTKQKNIVWVGSRQLNLRFPSGNAPIRTVQRGKQFVGMR